jgi:CRISPR/Cas system CSM-associated protein Csm5 (group 7 of RAMP superfamily)
MLLLKCLLIIQELPESSSKEAFEELKSIYLFHVNHAHQANDPFIPASSIKGKLRAMQVRPSMVLES